MKTFRGYVTAIALTVIAMVSGAGTADAAMVYSQIESFSTQQFVDSVNELENDRYLKIGVVASNDTTLNTGDYAYNVTQVIRNNMGSDVVSDQGDILPGTVVLALSPVFNKYNVQVGSRVGLTNTQRSQIEQAMRVEYGASSDVTQAAVAGAQKALELLSNTPDIQPPVEPEEPNEEPSGNPLALIVIALGAVLLVFSLVKKSRRNRYSE